MSKLISPVVPRLLCSSFQASAASHHLVELRGRERLGQVAVGADAHARGAVMRIVQRGDHHDRNQVRLAGSLEPVAELEAVDVGQHQVEQDQVGLPLADGRERLGSREDLDRFKPRACTRLARISLVSRSSSTTRTVRGMGKTRRAYENSTASLCWITIPRMAQLFSRRARR